MLSRSFSTLFSTAVRTRIQRSCFATATGGETAGAESTIRSILEKELTPTKLEVQDTSGGCGAMFNIVVESPIFKGKTLVAQHKFVTQILKKEIKEMHGLTLTTKVSS